MISPIAGSFSGLFTFLDFIQSFKTIATRKRVLFRRLEVKWQATWHQISEIPPCPPLKKGGWGDFGEFMHTPIFLFGSGPAGLGKVR
jgi:hypothetical protein